MRLRTGTGKWLVAKANTAYHIRVFNQGNGNICSQMQLWMEGYGSALASQILILALNELRSSGWTDFQRRFIVQPRRRNIRNSVPWMLLVAKVVLVARRCVYTATKRRNFRKSTSSIYEPRILHFLNKKYLYASFSLANNGSF